MSRKWKKTIKNLSLGILGLGILGGAVALGTNYLKNDSVNIHPSYEIGGLTEYGKYVEDECKLYTKDKFACDGLKATLDFDNNISYRIFYYDILDNFIEATDILTDGYSDNAPLNGAYARVEITPLDDEDGKISWMEKHDYASKLNLSVSKTADNVNEKFVSLNGQLLEIKNNTTDLVFDMNMSFDGTDMKFVEEDSHAVTSRCLLDVSGYKSITFDASTSGEGGIGVEIYQFYDLGFKKMDLVTDSVTADSITLNFNKNAKYVIISLYLVNDCNEAFVSNVQNLFTLNK